MGCSRAQGNRSALDFSDTAPAHGSPTAEVTAAQDNTCSGPTHLALSYADLETNDLTIYAFCNGTTRYKPSQSDGSGVA